MCHNPYIWGENIAIKPHIKRTLANTTGPSGILIDPFGPLNLNYQLSLFRWKNNYKICVKVWSSH